MTEYQSLFGTSTLRVDYIAAGQIQADELILPNGAQDGFILTSDVAGVASWQPDPNTLLAGDANGPLLNNTVTTLAGGTLNVSDLVTLTGNQTIQNKIIDESNTVIASILRNGAGTFQLSIEGDSPTTNQILAYKDGFIKFIDLDLEGDVISDGTTTKVQAVGGSTAEQIHNAEQLANAATSDNTPNMIVKRDPSGNFSAGTITADLNGNATTVTTNANLTGEVTSIGNATTVTNPAVISKLLTGFSPTTGTISATDSLLTFANKTTGNIAALSTSLNGVSTATPNTLALRDSSAGCSFNDVSINRLMRAGGYILDTSQGDNTLMGVSSGNRSITGIYNTFMGNGAGTAATSVYASTGIGMQALNAVTSAERQTAVGFSALYSATTGLDNTAVGALALAVSTGNYSTAVGSAALARNTTGVSNCALGYGGLSINATGSYNTTSGVLSLKDVYSGSYNSAFGYQAGNGAEFTNCTFLGANTTSSGYGTYTNSTAIGYGAIVSNSNTIQLGNGSVSSVQTSGTITCPAVTTSTLNGAVTVTSTLGASGLITGNSGFYTWSYPTMVGGGAYLGWNRTGASATGRTAFVNQQGLGSGGFEWLNYSNNTTISTPNPSMTLDSAGRLTASQFLGKRTGVSVVTGPASVPSGSTVLGYPSLGGSDAGGVVTVSTWPSSLTTGVIFTVTYNTAYSFVPAVTVTAGSSNAAGNGNTVWVTSSTTGFTLSTSSNLSTNQLYTWYYNVVG